MNEINALIKDAQESSLAPCLHVKTEQEVQPRWPSPNSANTLISDFSLQIRTVRNKFAFYGKKKKYYLSLSPKSHSHFLFLLSIFLHHYLPHNSQQKKQLVLSKILKIDDIVNPLSTNLTSFQGSKSLSNLY